MSNSPVTFTNYKNLLELYTHTFSGVISHKLLLYKSSGQTTFINIQ
jgi:hypothetical protein